MKLISRKKFYIYEKIQNKNYFSIKYLIFFPHSSSLKSVLRKTRMIANTTTTSPVAATATGGGGPSSGSSSPKDGKSKEAGYDFIEGSGFVIEGLEDKGLDAKSYIQQMLR